AARLAEGEGVDELRIAGNWIADELLADAKRGGDELPRGRPECRRLDPEVVGSRDGCLRGEGDDDGDSLHASKYGRQSESDVERILQPAPRRVRELLRRDGADERHDGFDLVFGQTFFREVVLRVLADELHEIGVRHL